MKKIIDRIFSEKYVIPGTNVIQLLMYRFAYPFAVLLNKLHLSPNQITTQSLIFSILAFIALVYDKGWVLFSIFWGVSVLLDFCDGTVARMTDRVSKTAFRYDHMSDIFKIYLVVMGVGIRYDDLLFWILSSTLIFFYGYFEILAHDLKNITMRKQMIDSSNASAINPTRGKRIRERFFIIGFFLEKFPLIMSIIKEIYKKIHAVLNTFNGHTLLFFFAFPVGGWVTKITLIYLIYLTVIGSIYCTNQLRHINR